MLAETFTFLESNQRLQGLDEARQSYQAIYLFLLEPNYFCQQVDDVIIVIGWRGDRVVDGAALEKRWAMSLVGSNPTLSATTMERCWSGRSGAPGERVSPLATVGSNPTLSAIFIILIVLHLCLVLECPNFNGKRA